MFTCLGYYQILNNGVALCQKGDKAIVLNYQSVYLVLYAKMFELIIIWHLISYLLVNDLICV